MIGGFLPCSFVDYPGALSAVIFFRGCNLRCIYCHNPHLISLSGSTVIEYGDLLAFLSSRRGLLSSVVFSGGEPTLQPNLSSVLRGVRDLGFAIKLDTNGTQPDVLYRLLQQGLVDYLAMDIKDPPETYTDLTRTPVDPRTLRRSIALVIGSNVAHEFRTTIVHPHHTLERLLNMARELVGTERWLLQPYVQPPCVPTMRPSTNPSLECMAAAVEHAMGIPCKARTSASFLPCTAKPLSVEARRS